MIPNNGNNDSSENTDKNHTPSVKFKVADDDDAQSFVESATAVNDAQNNEASNCLFIEMAELNNGREAWSESARWLKFEEDVEEGGRWSKPHVATVPLHSLFELRNILKDCVVLFDVQAESFAEIVDKLLDTFRISHNLSDEAVNSCRNHLLYRHTHQYERHILRPHDRQDLLQIKPIQLVRSFVDIRNRSNGHKTNDKAYKGTQISTARTQPHGLNKQSLSATPLADIKFKSSFLSGLRRIESHDSHKATSNIFKKLPPGTEATNVLIGGVDFLKYPLCAFVRFAKSQYLGDLTEVSIPTKFLFILLGPQNNSTYYYEVGRSISTLMSDELFKDISYKATNRNELIQGIDDFLEHVMVLPPGEWDPSGRIDPPPRIPEKEERLKNFPVTTALDDNISIDTDPSYQRTGRCCGGLVDDIKRKIPFFLSDIYDAWCFQGLATIIFMYFACLSPIVTFGGLLSKATDNNMGTIESLVAAAVCGCLYHSFAGQPLTILGSTGPVLIFETIVFSMCKRHNIDFMGLRVWIGIWMFLILAILVMTDGCSLISHITRFTEESFAALIGLIFIWEAMNKMIELHTNLHPELDGTCTDCINSMKSVLPGLSKEQCQNISIQFANASVAFSNEIHNVSLKSANCGALLNMSAIFWFSLVLFLTTFFLAFYLKNFKRKRYFPSKLRSLISNFSVVIIIGVTVTIDFLSQLGTPKLVVPDKFQNTRPNRGWFISPFGRISVLHCFISLFPAMLATILIFMDQNITTVIINRRENKLKKGCGYHLDMMIVAICIMINSLYGLPWFVAATVLSVNHVISLKIESSCKMPGEKPKFTGVIEQRATGFIAYTLIGLSVFLTKFLRHIPMPVLYGLFLFMGISSLAEIQFWNRVLLLFMPEKYQPDYIYLRHVSTRRVHLFTIIQMACMIVLWIVKSVKLIAIAFPLMVALLIAVRKLLGHIFTQRELMYLDDAKPESRKRAEEDAKKKISISITGTSAETNKPSKQGETECKKLITSLN